VLRFDALAGVHGVHVLDTIGDAYLAVTNLNGDQEREGGEGRREGGREGTEPEIGIEGRREEWT
jgi:hypothetical protein